MKLGLATTSDCDLNLWSLIPHSTNLLPLEKKQTNKMHGIVKHVVSEFPEVL